MNVELQKVLQSLKNSTLFKAENIQLNQKTIYVLRVVDSRGQSLDLDLPTENDHEATIYIQGLMSAIWLDGQIHKK